MGMKLNLSLNLQSPITPSFFPNALEISPAVAIALATFSQLNSSVSKNLQHLMPPSLFPDQLTLSTATHAALAEIVQSKNLKDRSQDVLLGSEGFIPASLFQSQLKLSSDTEKALAQLSSSSLEKPLNKETPRYIFVQDTYTKSQVECITIELEGKTLTFPKNLESLVAKILNSKAAYSLLAEALKGGSLTILIADPKAAPLGGFFLPESRRIYLDGTENTNRQQRHL